MDQCPDLTPNWGRLERDKMYWNLIWKSSKFFPLWAKLTHFGPKSDIHLWIERCVYQSVDHKEQKKRENLIIQNMKSKTVHSCREWDNPVTWALVVTDSWMSNEFRRNTGMVGLAPKWVRLAPNGTNPGLFQIRFQCIWRPAPNALKSDLIKSRICPIWGQSDPLWSQTYHPWVPAVFTRRFVYGSHHAHSACATTGSLFIIRLFLKPSCIEWLIGFTEKICRIPLYYNWQGLWKTTANRQEPVKILLHL